MRYKHKPKEYVVLSDWHVWFAWHPVRVGDTTVWFEKVWRKGTGHHCWDDVYIELEYRFFENHPPHPTTNVMTIPLPPNCQ